MTLSCYILAHFLSSNLISIDKKRNRFHFFNSSAHKYFNDCSSPVDWYDSYGMKQGVFSRIELKTCGMSKKEFELIS